MSAPPPAWDILGLGCVAVDELLYLDAFPAPDTKQPIQARQRQCGGQTGNALVAAARLGARCAYAGTLGHDEASQFVFDSLQREHIDVTRVRRCDAARPIRSTILVDQAGASRTVLYDLAGTVPASPDWPPEETVRGSKVLLVDQYGVEGMLRAARLARQAGRAVVADFEGDDWPGFDELLDCVDHLIVEQTFAGRRTGSREPADGVLRLWNASRKIVIVTCGAAGCWWMGDNQTTPQHQQAPVVAEVNTTGCGDVFRGAYMAALVRGLPAAERVRLASAAAALKATRDDGPTWEQLQNFVR
jgi:sulfofructose kinase